MVVFLVRVVNVLTGPSITLLLAIKSDRSNGKTL